MKKTMIIIIFVTAFLFSFTSCSNSPKGNVDFGDYEIPSVAETTAKYDESELISADESWQKAYALSYIYYDKKNGESKIAEGKCGNYYQSMDYATGIINYLEQQEGYVAQYMLNSNTKTGTSTVVTDGTMDTMNSGFMMLSVCDPYFPVYKNVKKVGTDFVAERPATRYKQIKQEDGKEVQIAYVWIDDIFGFASRCELYDAQTEELLMRWELQDFTQNVTDTGIRINLDAYEITAENNI